MPCPAQNSPSQPYGVSQNYLMRGMPTCLPSAPLSLCSACLACVQVAEARSLLRKRLALVLHQDKTVNLPLAQRVERRVWFKHLISAEAACR